MSVDDLTNREERPAYVRFERRAIEDKQASITEGRYVAKDVDFALVTPPYSKDCIEYKVTQWLINLDKNVRDGRVPEKWAEAWKEGYRRWQNGQEAPLSGTAIRGWGLISPAMQEMLIRMNCLAVEDLAQMNDEGLKRVGMGAIDLRNKAKNWLQSMKDHGPLAVQVTTLETENAILKGQVDTLSSQVRALMAAIPKPHETPISLTEETITASDLLDEPATLSDLKIPNIEEFALERVVENFDNIKARYETKFGKPVHHRMKMETVMEALKE